MNFYEFCLIDEKTAPEAFADADKKRSLTVYKTPAGEFDFRPGNAVEVVTRIGRGGKEITTEYRPLGTMSFDPVKVRQKIGIDDIIVISSALRWQPAKGGRDPYKVQLFHLARGRSRAKIDEIYKKDFYGAAVFKTADLVKEAKPDLIVYIDSTTDFNKDVISIVKTVPIRSIGALEDALLLNKRNYQFMINSVVQGNMRLFTTDTTDANGNLTNTGRILLIAFQRVLDTLQNGEAYNIDGKNITRDSPLSRERTASMITTEWEEAANQVEAAGINLNDDDKEMGKDVGFVQRHLTSYGHFDAANLRAIIPDPKKPINTIVVIDDNINKCATYNEVNRILKTLDQTKKAQIKWVVGIFKTENDKGCFDDINQ
jgi:hypothetical protein